MSAIHARARRCEQACAAILGSERVPFMAGVAKPDVRPIRLASGLTLIPEVKSTAAPPKRVLAILKQAEGYSPRGVNAIPIGVLYPKGERHDEAIAVLRLVSLARLLGLLPPEPGQLAIVPEAAP